MRLPINASRQSLDELKTMLQPLLDLITNLTKAVKWSDDAVEEIATAKYPEAAILRTVPGVGPIASLTFVLTIGDKDRFGTSRDVGAYLGLRPKRSQSGACDPQLRITKAGDHYLRKTLVQCAHYILGPLGPDTALRQWGLRLASRGGTNGKEAQLRRLPVSCLSCFTGSGRRGNHTVLFRLRRRSSHPIH